MSQHHTFRLPSVPANELRLGDQVQMFSDSYGWATVSKADDETVTLTRPFVHLADFTYTGGRIPYIGIETIKSHRDSGHVYQVVRLVANDCKGCVECAPD